jgi:hypothetical protein
MLDCQLFGVRPGPPHAINALLHAVNSALLFLVLKQMTGAFWRSAIVAALFAWHPLRAESVAWVSERKDVLGALLWILSLWAYVRYAEEFKVQSSRFKVFYGLALVFFALGLMAKPMVITLPFLLLVLDGWPLKRLAPMSINSSRRLLWEKAPFFLLAAGSAAITMKAQSTGQVADLRLVPVPLRLSNSLVSYAGYLEKIFWPAKLSFMYPLNFNLPVGFALAALGLLVCISVVAVLVWRNSPYWLAGWFWYLGILLPVIGLVQVGAQSMADRYSYLPSIGIFIIVCWTAEQFTRRWRARKILLGLAAALTLGACALLTNAQLKYWRNSETLFRHALAVNPNNYLAHFYYGRHLRQQGKWPLAELEFQQSIALMPTLVFSYTDLSDLLAREGKTDQAMVPLRQVLKIRPDLSEARCALAALLFKQQLLPQAETELEEGLKLWVMPWPRNRSLPRPKSNSPKPCGSIPMIPPAITNGPWPLLLNIRTPRPYPITATFCSSRPISPTPSTIWPGFWPPALTSEFATARKPSNWPCAPARSPRPTTPSKSKPWPTPTPNPAASTKPPPGPKKRTTSPWRTSKSTSRRRISN